mmetsp:Transcript_62493/g.165865  ORF Transcript_62493/g.165865 Transcript_62493/m.165865 type:complete len:150 (-) Transcript_62493:450-899(-)
MRRDRGGARAALPRGSGSDGGGGGSSSSGGGGGGGAEANALELLSVVRRDKELLVRKNEMLSLEVGRLTEQHAALGRQHALSQARLAELQLAAESGDAAAKHEAAMADLRELNLLRDSNALMRQREAQREAQHEVVAESVEAAVEFVNA